jgi:glycosyltransferase involved in cell wall biosynthesis
MADHDNLFFLVVFSIFASTAAIQLFYYLFSYLGIHFHKPSVVNLKKEPVSIIICARNEAENLRNFLPSILEQDYPDYEVIVVNDCSEDHSWDVLQQFQYHHLKVSNVIKDPKFTHFKKFAQFIGIKAAKNDILLFTEADCQPESDKWIEGMISNFGDKITFVLGYGGYLSEKGLLNKYIRYDSMTVAMNYLGMAIRGIPFMGIGRNLAYRRSVFFLNKGYGAHNHINYGEDDLFVNTNASGNNTCVEYRNGTKTRAVPYSRFKDWATQKKKLLTTAPYYKFREKLLLRTEPISRVIFYLTFILLLSNSFLLPIVSAIFSLRLLIQIIVFTLVQKKLNEPRLVIYSLFFDIFSPVINSIVLFSNTGNRTGKNRWK